MRFCKRTLKQNVSGKMIKTLKLVSSTAGYHNTACDVLLENKLFKLSPSGVLNYAHPRCTSSDLTPKKMRPFYYSYYLLLLWNCHVILLLKYPYVIVSEAQKSLLPSINEYLTWKHNFVANELHSYWSESNFFCEEINMSRSSNSKFHRHLCTFDCVKAEVNLTWLPIPSLCSLIQPNN